MSESQLLQVVVPEKAILRRIQIEPTNRCNFTCGYCRRTHWTRPEGDMCLDRFRVVLDRLPEVPYIHLQGVGEPLLNKELPSMIQYARSQRMRVGTNTNASFLSLERAKVLLDAGVNRVNLSIDTLDPSEFRRLRPGSTIEKVLSNIAILAEIRSKGDYRNIKLALAVVTVRSAIDSIGKVIELAADLGLDEVYLQNLNGSFLPADYFAVGDREKDDYDRYWQATQSAEALASKLGIRFLYPLLGAPDFSWRCRWPLYGCNITWDGFVSPCCLQPDPDVLNFGNLFEMDFEDIWNSSAYHRFRAQVQADCEPICARCPDRYGQMWHPNANPFAEVKP